METPTDGGQEWRAADYDDAHSFVAAYGSDLVSVLEPAPGDRILDLGCGTGHCTAEIADAGATVVGLDASEAMLARARREYPDLSFRCTDARSFSVDEPVDAVFSNAVLHWIPDGDQDDVLASVRDALEPGGRFVAELGASGNVAPIVDAVSDVCTARGYESDPATPSRDPWYFPSIGEYAPRLEAHGFEVRDASVFDRPTDLEGGEAGLDRWLETFGDRLLESVPDHDRDDVVAAVADSLREEWFSAGTWIAPYRRLRFVAVATTLEE